MLRASTAIAIKAPVNRSQKPSCMACRSLGSVGHPPMGSHNTTSVRTSAPLVIPPLRASEGSTARSCAASDGMIAAPCSSACRTGAPMAFDCASTSRTPTGPSCSAPRATWGSRASSPNGATAATAPGAAVTGQGEEHCPPGDRAEDADRPGKRQRKRFTLRDLGSPLCCTTGDLRLYTHADARFTAFYVVAACGVS